MTACFRQGRIIADAGSVDAAKVNPVTAGDSRAARSTRLTACYHVSRITISRSSVMSSIA
jgi:hypothetical protein